MGSKQPLTPPRKRHQRVGLKEPHRLARALLRIKDCSWLSRLEPPEEFRARAWTRSCPEIEEVLYVSRLNDPEVLSVRLLQEAARGRQRGYEFRSIVIVNCSRTVCTQLLNGTPTVCKTLPSTLQKNHSVRWVL